MAVPGSGTLSLLGIRRELGDDDYSASTNYTNISLNECSDGTVATINTQNNASFRPLQGDNGDKMSEFYGYDHDLANVYTLPTPTASLSVSNVCASPLLSTDLGTTTISIASGILSNGDNASAAGWIWKHNNTDTAQTPTLSDKDGTITDTNDFHDASASATTTDLYGGYSNQTHNRKYYIRAYATNLAGTAYSAVLTYHPTAAPCATTGTPSSVDEDSMTLNGSIVNTGNKTMNNKGFVYSSTVTTPTVATSGVSNQSTGSSGLDNVGSYSVDITGLSSGTTYYIRAYASNTHGYSYGDVVTQATSAALTAPSLTIAVVSPVLWNGFSVDGVITSTGGASITAHGIVASKTNTNPTIGASGVLQFSDTSISQTSFTSNANSGVLGTQTWYVRGYATNSVGTTYTNAVTVNTPRRPLTVKFNFTKQGITSVCTETNTMTIFNETNNTFNTMVQLGDPIYVNADPTDNDQSFGALAHWFSDGNRKRRWGQTSWTSSQSTC